MMLVQEEDRPMLATYRSYLRHKDVRRLTSALIKLTALRRAPNDRWGGSTCSEQLLALLKIMSDVETNNENGDKNFSRFNHGRRFSCLPIMMLLKLAKM